jgi:hypothetical protein
MSEAERLGNNPESPDAIAPLSGGAIPATPMPVESLVPPSDDGWQVVNFPAAVSVDAIPRASAEGIEGVAVAEVESRGESEAAGQVQPLQQENAELRDRIAQLEQGLAQAQVELQLATLQLWQEKGEAAVQQHAESVQQAEQLVAAQEHINRLFQELELSHQTAQRQQILVETLTEQLESSQERIAQLERECALIQQRYNEQLQQLLQTENTCRDLRTRLHRQQQQALQFKVALEKSLDMSGSQRNPLSLANPAPGNAAVAGIVAADLPAQTFALQNQPVQPWSVGEQPTNLEADLSDPLAKLLSLNAEYGQPAVEIAASDLSTSFNFSAQDPAMVSSLMQHLFADAATAPNSLAVEPDQPAAIFDLGPFLEAGELSSEIVSDDVAPQDAVMLEATSAIADVELVESLANLDLKSDASITEEPQLDEGLWDELARMIDATPAVGGAIEMQQEASTENLNPEHPNFEQQNVVTPSIKRLNLLPISRSSEIQRQDAIHPTNQDNSSAPSSVLITPEEALVEVTTPVQSALTASWPSPVLYPMRSSRKLGSMSAVQLPSFRQAKQELSSPPGELL